MGIKPLYLFDRAERLYVVEGHTQIEIARVLRLAESTICNWKKRGNWKEKRAQYNESKKAFHEELYEFARKLMRSIISDVDSGRKIDAVRMYALKGIIPQITKIKDYEDAKRKQEEQVSDKETSIGPEFIQNLIKDIYGI